MGRRVTPNWPGAPWRLAVPRKGANGRPYFQMAERRDDCPSGPPTGTCRLVPGWLVVCLLWIRNKLPLSNMSSSTRYNGPTGFGRYSPLGGAGGASHLPTRIVPPGEAQSIGLVEGIPNLISEPNGVEYLTQRTSTDALVGYTEPTPEAKGLNESQSASGCLAPPAHRPHLFGCHKSDCKRLEATAWSTESLLKYSWIERLSAPSCGLKAPQLRAAAVANGPWHLAGDARTDSGETPSPDALWRFPRTGLGRALPAETVIPRSKNKGAFRRVFLSPSLGDCRVLFCFYVQSLKYRS
jgi:hypothetical protein